MNPAVARWIKRIVVGVFSLIMLAFLLPILFPGQIEQQIKTWVNQSIKAELNFKKARLSFFQHFPTLTLSLYDYSLTGAAPFEKDSLLAGESIAFGINLASLFKSDLEVDRFYVNDSRINVLVNQEGRANYAVYSPQPQHSNENATRRSSTSLQIRGIDFTNCSLFYKDASIPVTITAEKFNYKGTGLLDQEEFDLKSHLETESLSFSYDGTTYIDQRRIEADLLTGVNTQSLAFRFQKNNILINKLPVDFTGTFYFVKDGYDINLSVVSGNTDFGNIFSVLPPEFDTWFANTKFSGNSRITLDLQGAYRASTHQMPDIHIACKVSGGSILHKGAPEPIKNLHFETDMVMPGLNPDSFSMRVDSLYFTIKNDPTKLKLFWKGSSAPTIKGSILSAIDLTLANKALGLNTVDLQGSLNLEATIDGKYETAQNPNNYRPDTIIVSLPSYQLKALLQKGHLKFSNLPLALSMVEAKLESSLKTNKWQDAQVQLKQLSATVGTGKLQASGTITNFGKPTIDGNALLDLRLEELNKIFPLEQYTFGGRLQGKLTAKGIYDSANTTIPQMDMQISWTEGRVKTPHYKEPLDSITLQVSATARNTDGTDASIQLRDAKFTLDNQPFELRGNFQNLQNLHYDVQAKGRLHLDHLYAVLNKPDYAFGGDLNVNITLKGTQSDINNKKYNRLQQAGTIEVSEVRLIAKQYPAPFFIPKALVVFQREHAWLKNTTLVYKKNSLDVSGDLQQFMGYLCNQSNLSGQLTVRGSNLIIDDFMAFDDLSNHDTSTQNTSSGVVLLPDNIAFQLNAAFDTVRYGSSILHKVKSSILLKNQQLVLQETTAKLAGAKLQITGVYTPSSPTSASFSIKAKADSFDVQQAYAELALFREMVPSAAYTKGVISTNYELNGRLNEEMSPVYPSLKGKGTLVLEKVQVKGLRLFNAVSKAVGKDSVNNPNLKAVVIKSNIQNNLLSIERTRMRIFGFRPRVEGQVSLDGNLNLKFRLGLPPLGIVGIPMTITGTKDAPIVKIRRGNKEDELDETEDTTEDRSSTEEQ